jgi:hypothetical protein
MFTILIGLSVVIWTLAFIHYYLPSKMKIPEGMAQCDLCDELCDSTGEHFNTKFRFHKLHLMRKRWGQPLFQGKFKHLKLQRDKIKAARDERAVQIRELKKSEVDFEDILEIPVGEDFVKLLEREKMVEAVVSSLDGVDK